MDLRVEIASNKSIFLANHRANHLPIIRQTLGWYAHRQRSAG